jgi:hypothetical protein
MFITSQFTTACNESGQLVTHDQFTTACNESGQVVTRDQFTTTMSLGILGNV